MKILVCDGRDFTDQVYLFRWLDEFNRGGRVTHLTSEGAGGADRLAVAWAITRRVAFSEYLPDWKKYGKDAGPRRNQQMLEQNPSAVIAFPGGAGTADMVRRAKLAGIKVYDGGREV